MTAQATALTASYRIDRRTNLPNRSVLREKLSKMTIDNLIGSQGDDLWSNQ
ncbi:hypothetical protein OH492_01715 [Vibrio chagasii]|nr:hypothetical protein [Vibrio chagasii]